MFKERLERISKRIDAAYEPMKRLDLTHCATPAQIAGFEMSLGLALPDEYREFILQVGDGCWGIQSLFEENTTNPYWSSMPLVVFPLKQTDEDRKSYLCDLVRWGDLNDSERMEAGVALRFALYSGVYFRTLVLSGPQRGRVWSSANRLDLGKLGIDQCNGLFFLDWVERILDEQV